MLQSLSIVIIAAVLALVALFLFLGSNVQDKKKQEILVVMGSLLLLAILISNFKSNDKFSFSILNKSGNSPKESGFTAPLPQFSPKYPLDPKLLSTHLLTVNYRFPLEKDKDPQHIIYISQKNEGATYFLYQLSQKLRSLNYPVLYIKLEIPQINNKQFLRKTGYFSYQQFRNSLDQYLRNKQVVYVVVDNAQFLPEPVFNILIRDSQNGVGVVFGTENSEMLLERIVGVEERANRGNAGSAGHEQYLDKSGSAGHEQFLDKFQVQKFIGPDAGSLQKLSPTNSLSKKLALTFKNIVQLKSGSSQQQIILRSTNINNNVANYFGLLNQYSQIKRLLERGVVTFAKLRTTNITYQDFCRLNRVGLVTVSGGIVGLE